MAKSAWLPTLNVVLTVVMLTVNVLAVALPLNGQTTAQISDRFNAYFIPAGYVFSIWSLIYVGCIAYAVYQALPAQRLDRALVAVGPWFALSNVANALWLVLWHYEYFVLTVVCMLVLLVALMMAYSLLRVGLGDASPSRRWLVHLPFSLYLGWIAVATLANLSVVLSYLQWGGRGLSPEVWAVIMLIVGLGIASVIAVTRGDTALVAVFVWAYVGIALKQAAVPMVAGAAWAGTVVLIVVAVLGVLLGRRRAVLRGQRAPTAG